MSTGPVERDADTAEFFDGTSRGEFLLRHCLTCGAFSPPNAVQCDTCRSTALEWQPAAGGARLISWAVTHARPADDGSVETAVIVIAEFDEGPWWWSQLVQVDPAAVVDGMPLRVTFERNGEFEAVPVFVPAEQLACG